MSNFQDGAEDAWFLLDTSRAVKPLVWQERDGYEFQSLDLSIDYAHQSDLHPDQRTGTVPAAGWIKELKVDGSGLWGRVEWTAPTRELIAGKAYRYLSPSYYHTKAGNIITRLKGAGLVHKPNLHLHARPRQETDMTDDETLLVRLIAAPGLPDDTTDDQLLEMIEMLRGKAEKATPTRRTAPEIAPPPR